MCELSHIQILLTVDIGVSIKPTNFIRFTKLPMELQCQIWEDSVPSGKDSYGRRILTLTIPTSERIIRVDLRKRGNFVTFPEIFDIGMLKACRSSRKAFIKVYPKYIKVWKGLVWINRETTIVLDCFQLPPLAGLHPSFSNITKLAIDDKVLDRGLFCFERRLLRGPHLLEILPNLECVAVINDKRWRRWNRSQNTPLRMDAGSAYLERYKRGNQELKGLPKIEVISRH